MSEGVGWGDERGGLALGLLDHHPRPVFACAAGLEGLGVRCGCVVSGVWVARLQWVVGGGLGGIIS